MSLNLDGMTQYFNGDDDGMAHNENDIESPSQSRSLKSPTPAASNKSNTDTFSTQDKKRFFPATSPFAPASNFASSTTATPMNISHSHHGTATSAAAAVAAVDTKGLSQTHHGYATSPNAPEPPKWRFISDAKKSSGYNSLAAGKYIQGKSADELGAKYTAPDISLYRQKKEEPEVGKMIIREWNYPEDEMPKEEEFGGLPKAMEKEHYVKKGFKGWGVHYPIEPKKGRTTEWRDGEIDTFYEVGDDGFPDAMDHQMFGKIKHGEGPSNVDEFSGQYLRDKKGNEECKESEDGDSGIEKGVALEEASTNSSDGSETFNSETGLFPNGPAQIKMRRRECCLLLLILLLLIGIIILGFFFWKNKNQEKAAVAGGSGFLPAGIIVVLPVISSSAPSIAPSAFPTANPSMECPIKFKPFSIEQHPRESVSMALDEEMLTYNATWLLRDACSGEVVKQCLPCSAMRSSSINDDEKLRRMNIFDGSTANSLGFLNLATGANENSDKSNKSMYRDGHFLQNITECLPSDNEYVFEVHTQDAETCCGFDPTSFFVTYDHEMLVMLKNNGKQVPQVGSTIESKTFFGERVAPCPSDAPTAWPSVASSGRPSLLPSEDPTTTPSRSPSLSPSEDPTPTPSESPSVRPSGGPTKTPTQPPTPLPTRFPTASPVTNSPTPFPTESPTAAPATNPPTKNQVAFLGGCPEMFDQLSYYSVGTQVESGEIIYECITVYCDSYGFEPGSTSSSLWTHGWKVVGACSGTIAPTSKPTLNPTRLPTSPPTTRPTGVLTRRPSFRPTMIQTNRPTPKPTCSTNNNDFNLCIALDMSGSVCNSGMGFECTGCEPALFCRSFFADSDTCCYNFESVAGFSKSMVTSLGEFPADKSFSVVQFATDASLVNGLSSVEQTMSSLNWLYYSGGLTNHVDAIKLCQESLSSSSFPNRKNFIMLVTDGGATVPEFNPEVAAEAAATNAKDAGTFIIPVFISPSNDLTTLSFMRRMSSDGQVFDVGDFESLNSLQERLVNQVSCQT